MSSADLAIQLGVFQAVTLSFAGIGKLASRGSFWGRLQSLLELLFACAILAAALSGMAAGVVRILALGLFAAYFAYAVTRHATDRCACFGDHLPSASKRWQVWRNGSYLVSALLSMFLPRDPELSLALLDITVGTLVACGLIAAPRATSWIAGAE